MSRTFQILAIVGSASKESSNHRLVAHLQELAGDLIWFRLYQEPGVLPHFDPELTIDNVPDSVADLRGAVNTADGVLICTPEYIFSIPARLKNLFEWCVATTVFTDKPAALITASASGVKGHEELRLIMKTLGARFSESTSLLIQGIKGKMTAEGQVQEQAAKMALAELMRNFEQLLREA
jgi:chromate reductase